MWMWREQSNNHPILRKLIVLKQLFLQIKESWKKIKLIRRKQGYVRHLHIIRQLQTPRRVQAAAITRASTRQLYHHHLDEMLIIMTEKLVYGVNGDEGDFAAEELRGGDENAIDRDSVIVAGGSDGENVVEDAAEGGGVGHGLQVGVGEEALHHVVAQRPLRELMAMVLEGLLSGGEDSERTPPTNEKI